MIGIHKRKLSDWCNNNIDLLVIAAGAAIVLSTNQLEGRFSYTRSQDIEFWTLLIGVVILSVGTSALICHRVLSKWYGFFS